MTFFQREQQRIKDEIARHGTKAETRADGWLAKLRASPKTALFLLAAAAVIAVLIFL